MLPALATANFSIPTVGPDYDEVQFPEMEPPQADAIVAHQRRVVRIHVQKALPPHPSPT